jgi:cytochrome c biogenesis protein CcmG/thiol:disulfide interchange protein DsbE
MNKKALQLLVYLMTMAFISSSGQAQNTAMGVKIGEKAPDFTLQDLRTGEHVRLYDLVGKKIIMLDFWAPFCDICRKEMPGLVQEYNRYRERGFELLSIVVYSGDLKDVRDIMEAEKLNYPVLYDKDFYVAMRLYRLAGPIPVKVIIDHRGIVRYAHVGDHSPHGNEVPLVLESLIAEMKGRPQKD